MTARVFERPYITDEKGQASMLLHFARRGMPSAPRPRLLSGEVDAVLQELFIVRGIEVVLGADVLLKACALPQHDSGMKSPGLGQHVGIFDGDVVVDLVLVHAGIALRDM